MTCASAKRLIGPYIDGELTDIVRVLELETHVAECPDCAREMAALRKLSAAILEQGTYFEASSALRDKIKSRSGIMTIDDRFKATATGKVWRNSGLVALAACLILATVSFLLLLGRGNDHLEADLVTDHVRSLQANHLFDVASASQHTVKPWFQGKLDFSPTVPDLTADGFPLLGGRLDYVERRPAAALVYSRSKHIINVFVFRPIGFPTEAGNETRNGFNIVKWTDGDLAYCAISDLNPAELQEFALKFKSRK